MSQKKNRRNRCWNLALSSIFVLCMLGNSPLLFAESQHSKLYFDHLTIQEGLSHNSVYSILQDKYGYIWIGTQNGLNKYDGYSFQTIETAEEGAGFQGKRISALFEDSSGRLWVGTARNGINLREASSANFVNLKNHAAFEHILDFEIAQISEDKKGNVYFSTIGGGFLKYNPISEKSTHFTAEQNGLSTNVVFDIQEDHIERLWIAGAGSGLNYMTADGNFHFLNYAEAANPNLSGYRKRLLIEEKNVWLATEGTGLYKISLDDFSYKQISSYSDFLQINTNSVRDIIRLDSNSLLIATDGGGLYVLDEKNEKLSHYEYKIGASTGLNSNALLDFQKDKENNIWIGTYNGGLNIIKANKTWFEHYSPETAIGAKMTKPSVLSIAEIGENIVLGTDGGGLNILNQNMELSASELDLPSNVVKCIFEDSEMNVWYGLFERGLFKVDQNGNSRSFFSDPNEVDRICGNVIWSMTETNDGELWIATLDKGICIYSYDTDSFRPVQELGIDSDGVLQDNIMVLFTDSKNRVWIGSAGNGLMVYDKSKGLSHFKNDPENSNSLSNNEVRSIYEDSNGDIWIGTESGGLNKWNADGSFTHYTTKEGLIANSVMALMEDEDGELWISTFRGLSKLNPESASFENFDFRSNENSNQFNQMSLLKDKDGNLYFGGINGLHVLNPKQLKKRKSGSEIVFTGLKIFGENVKLEEDESLRKVLKKPIEEAESIYLSHNEHSFRIQFSAFDFDSPKASTFQFKMDNFDEDWRTTEPGNHFASYTNIDPGTYTFKVKSMDAVSSIGVHIKPPFYKTLLFRLLALLLGLTLAYYLFQFWISRRDELYKQQMLKAEAEILQLKNEKLAAEINTKNSKLMFSSVQMAHKNDTLRELKEELKSKVGSDSNSDLRTLLRTIDSEIKGEDYWQEFNIYFEQTDHEFINSLIKRHPKLTQNDLRLCSLLRLRLSTKEIASLLNISVRGVEQSRYRLKKRLELTNNEDLVKYIAGLDHKT